MRVKMTKDITAFGDVRNGTVFICDGVAYLKVSSYFVTSLGTTLNSARLDDGKMLGIMDHVPVVVKLNARLDVDPEVKS